MTTSLMQLYTKGVRTVNVSFYDETIAVRYKPLTITPALIAELSTARNLRAQEEQITLSLVDGWELTDADGNELLVNTETLSRLPNEFLTAVNAAIWADVRAPRDDEKKA